MRDSEKPLQSRLFEVAEITVTYSKCIPTKDRIQIRSSNTAYSIFAEMWDNYTMEYREEFCVLYMDRSNRVLGIHHHSTGGISGTVVDVRQILAIALKVNATSFILCHNHPSGALKPSSADIEVTKKIKDAAMVMELSLLDNLIIRKCKTFCVNREIIERNG